MSDSSSAVAPPWPFRYSAYGLDVISNEEIPALPGRNYLNNLPLFVWCSRSEDGPPVPHLPVPASGAQFDVSYPEGIRFTYHQPSRRLEVCCKTDVDPEDVAYYLNGAVMRAVLALGGVCCLHASAVTFAGNALAFSGAGGSGKSTLAAVLCARGARLLADDIVALDRRGERFWIQPGYPRLNLWPPSTQALFGAGDPSRRLSSTWEKRFLAFDEFETCPRPLESIYLLAPQASDFRPSVTDVRPSEAVAEMMTHTGSSLLDSQDQTIRNLPVIAALVRAARVRRLEFPADLSRLRELGDLLLRSLAA